jgi:hypothetical protein
MSGRRSRPSLLRCIVPVALDAQTVTGAILDSASGRPVQEFTIHLMDAGGRSVAATLSRPGGRFSLRAPVADRYSLVVMRIGYRRVQSTPFTLHAEETRERTLRMAQIPATLSAIHVDGSQQCDVAASEGRDFASVWTQVQSAVQAVELTTASAPLVMTVRDYSRGTSVRGAVQQDSSVVRTGRARAPYQSRDPQAIADSGYVQYGATGTTYLAPDARLLLSDQFIASHCFRLRSGTADGAALIGVSFTPTAGRQLPDIRGTVWIDRSSAELRSLDFTYTGLPRVSGDRGYGGRVNFQHIPGGAWIIKAWHVIGPVYAQTVRQVTSGGSYGTGGIARTVSVVDSTVARLYEEGGEVLAARDERGAVLWASAYSTVRGVVRDSTTGRSVAGTEVSLRGTPLHTVTARDGSFAIDSVPPGDYTLVARIPLLEAQTRAIRIGRQSLDIAVGVPLSAAESADSVRVAGLEGARCVELRTHRNAVLRAVFATPIDRWVPTGADSATLMAAMRGAPTVLQAIADTIGRVEMPTVRAIKRGPAMFYREAMVAIEQMTRVPDQPAKGCLLRQLVILPYHVRTEK